MITRSTPRGIVQLQSFVFVEGLLHKVGAQRGSDAYLGHRKEPVLADSVVRLFSARVTENGLDFGMSTVAAFDSTGTARQDLHQAHLLAILNKVPLAQQLQSLRVHDEQAQRFVACSEEVLCPTELVSLASVAKTLPTKVS